MTQVSLQDLSKTYPGSTIPAIDDLNLEIASGSLTALLGPSGCGKTTLLKMITGLLDPTSGDICFDGESILPLAPEKREAVLVFQNHLLFPYMSIADNIGFGLRMRGLPATDIATQVEQMLELVRLPGFGARRPQQLSGGQQQRVALARSLIVRPRVLLLDEPLSNLDAHLRQEMRDFIRDLQQQTKVTCILVTHDQEEAVELADQIALLDHGQLLQYAPPVDFFEQPASKAVAHFFRAGNFIPGEHDGTIFTCALGKFKVPAPAGAGRYLAVLRPECLKLVSRNTPHALPCSIKTVSYRGNSCQVVGEVGDSAHPITLTVEAPPLIYHQHRSGEQFALLLESARIWLVPDDPTAVGIGK